MTAVSSPTHRGPLLPVSTWSMQALCSTLEDGEEVTEELPLPPAALRGGAVSSPIQCRVLQVERRRPDSPRSPPVVPPIPEDEEEELIALVAKSGQEERTSFIKKLRRSSLTFRDSLRRRLSHQSLEEFQGKTQTKVKRRSGSPDYRDYRRSSSPDYLGVARPPMARRQSTIGVIVQSEFQAGRLSSVGLERSFSGDHSLGRARGQGPRRASLAEQGKGSGVRRKEGERKERGTYWKLPGVQEDDD